MKFFTLTLFFCVGLTCLIFSAPPNNQDCANAIPVCQNTYSTTTSYGGQGNVINEINATNSCLGTGETNDVWYIITVTGSGNLNFSIRPKNYVNIFGVIFCDDYDWAVYNLTNAQCSDIYTDPTLEVSCNFSGTQDITGTRNSGTLNTQDATGNTWNKSIPVLAGQTYFLNVSNFSGSQSGYDLSFAGSTASIFDNIKPSVLSIAPQCNSTVNVKFSENVLCSTVQGSDFTVTGPGGPYTAVITTSSCLTGSTYENDFGLTISPPFS